MIKNKALLLFALLCLVIARQDLFAMSHAEQLKMAIENASKRDDIMEIIRRLADEEKNPEAAYELAYRYETGWFCARNLYDQVFKYLRQAVGNEHTQAMVALGFYYFHGYGGLVRDRSKALKLWTHAAILGEPRAQVRLGEIYANGLCEGVEKNEEIAIMWILLAIKNGLTNKHGDELSKAMAMLWILHVGSFSDPIPADAVIILWKLHGGRECDIKYFLEKCSNFFDPKSCCDMCPLCAGHYAICRSRDIPGTLE